MKQKIFVTLSLTLLLYSSETFGQWTDTTGGILYSSGNVGIANGSLTPAAKLHIKAGSGSYPQLLLHESGGTKTLKLGHDGTNGIVEAGSGDLILSGDNVGIGTTNPATSLHVRHSSSGESISGIAGMVVENEGSSNSSYVFQTATQGGGKSFSITNAGNVGIGTSTPNSMLSKLEAGTTGTDHVMNRWETAAGGGITLRASDLAASNPGWQFNTYSGETLSLSQAGLDRLFIKSDGNVGMGTTSPFEKAEINGNLLIRNPSNNGALILSPANAGYGTKPELYIQSSETGSGSNSAFHISRNALFRTSDDTYQYIDENGAAAIGLSFGLSDISFNYAPIGTGTLNWATTLFIQGTSGNVGIGTTNPTQKLEVAGTVYSQEVKVEIAAGTGPDYVFEPDYDLRTLEEIKDYIEENKHLPEVPSAKEMEANGVQLGEMNILLLKKIEELTLYQIELLERLDQQQAEFRNQQVELMAQQKQIEELKKRLN